jgi:cell division protein ZipA
MKIYNKLIANHENQILFSVANMMSPGTLTPDQLATLKTKGLVFFATLPKPINGLTIFDEMLDTAIKTANKLNGELCDDKHQPITDNYLEHIRSKILHFNLTTQMEQSPS